MVSKRTGLAWYGLKSPHRAIIWLIFCVHYTQSWQTIHSRAPAAPLFGRLWSQHCKLSRAKAGIKRRAMFYRRFLWGLTCEGRTATRRDTRPPPSQEETCSSPSGQAVRWQHRRHRFHSQRCFHHLRFRTAPSSLGHWSGGDSILRWRLESRVLLGRGKRSSTFLKLRTRHVKRHATGAYAPMHAQTCPKPARVEESARARTHTDTHICTHTADEPGCDTENGCSATIADDGCANRVHNVGDERPFSASRMRGRVSVSHRECKSSSDGLCK